MEVIIILMVMQRMLRSYQCINIMAVIVSSHDQYFLADGNTEGAMMIVTMTVVVYCW